MTIELVHELELSPAAFFADAGASFFSVGSLDLDVLGTPHFAEGTFFDGSGAGFFTAGAVDLDAYAATELSPAAYTAGAAEAIFNGASRTHPDYLDMIPVVLPMRPGDTAFEIAFRFRAIPDSFVTLEDLMDLLTYAGDIRLALEDGAGALEIKQNDLGRDNGLETALLVSLFTDRRATIEQVRAAGLDDSDLRGWWGDAEAEEPIGSLLWLLGRTKMTAQTLAQARDYALQAWQWLIRDGAASAIDAIVERTGTEEIAISVRVRRPQAAEDVNFRWYYNWQAQLVRRAA